VAFRGSPGRGNGIDAKIGIEFHFSINLNKRLALRDSVINRPIRAHEQIRRARRRHVIVERIVEKNTAVSIDGKVVDSECGAGV
jgi:hypothetical protein